MPLPRHPMPIPRLPNSILNIKLRQNVNGNSLTYSSRPGVLQNSDRKHEQSDINGEMAFQIDITFDYIVVLCLFDE